MNTKIGFDLSVTPYGKVKDEKYELAILPWGATEPHNLHLPYRLWQKIWQQDKT